MINCCCIYGDEGNIAKVSPEVAQTRKNLAIVKTTIFAIGLLLAIGAIVVHNLHMHAMTAYSLGGGGGALMLGSIVASVLHMLSMGREIDSALDRKEKADTQQKENDALLVQMGTWAREGKREEIFQALQDKPVPTHSIANTPLEALNLAAAQGDAELLTLLLDKGADPFQPVKVGVVVGNLLHLAAISTSPTSLEVMKVLIQRAPELVNRADNSSNTKPLGACAFCEWNELVRDKINLLLENGADVNDGLLPAVRKGKTEFLEFLIEKGADVTKIPDLMHEAVTFSSEECMRIILQKAPDLATQEAAGKGRPLEYLVMKCYFPISDPDLLIAKIKLLIEHGAHDDRLIGLVAYLGSDEVLNLLIEREVDLSFVCAFTQHVTGSALQLATESPHKGSLECMRTLLKTEPALIMEFNSLERISKQITHVISEEKRTFLCAKLDLLIESGANMDKALRLAASLGHPTAVQNLLKRGADPKTGFVETTVFYAAIQAIESYYEGSVECLEILLRHSKDLANFKRTEGMPVTLLNTAIRKIPYEVGENELSKTRQRKVQLLIQEGADVNAKNHEYGETPLQTALSFPDIDIIEALSEAGAIWDITSRLRETPLKMAQSEKFQAWLDQTNQRERFESLEKQLSEKV